MSETVLSIQGLHAGYGRAEVLSGIDLSAPKGSIITVIGPNGAGKSTFLNALMGVLPSKGSIHFEGRDISPLSLEERVMLGIALVPEKRELFGTMPVEDNLLLGAFRQVRLRNKQWREQIDVVYEIFPRLKERRLQLAGTLSGGERQMLMIGRAILGSPKVLLLDEPTEGLAPGIVTQLKNTFKALSKNTALVIVEQNLPLVCAISDKVYAIKDGTIVAEIVDKESIRVDVCERYL